MPCSRSNECSRKVDAWRHGCPKTMQWHIRRSSSPKAWPQSSIGWPRGYDDAAVLQMLFVGELLEF